MTNQPVAKVLGIWMLIALVAGNMIGSGAFLLPSTLSAYGSISLLAWGITSVGALLLALIFARLSTVLPPTSGGPYIYCREAFGELVGAEIALIYWVALWIGNTAIVVTAIGYAGKLLPFIACDEVLFTLFGKPIDYSAFFSVLLVWSITVVNWIGVKEAGFFQLITTILKIIPLIFFAGVGVYFFLNPSLDMQPLALNVSEQSNIKAISSTALLTFWAFIGLESATVPADSVKDPKRNIPRATILGVLIAAVIYICSTTAVMHVVGLDFLQNSDAPFSDAIEKIWKGDGGAIAGMLISVAAIVSCLGALNGWVLMQGQVPMAAARDGLFPKIFAKQTKKGVPVVGLVASTILITCLLVWQSGETIKEQFTLLIDLATFLGLVAYLFCIFAFIKLVALNKLEKKRGLAIGLSLAAMAYVAWAMIGGLFEEGLTLSVMLFSMTGLLVTGALLFLWKCHQQKART